MVQLWVNLPAKDKSAPAAYQTVLDRDIPTVALPDEAGIVRVIAGNYAGHAGPARTFTPIDLWDLRLKQGGSVVFDLPDQHTTGPQSCAERSPSTATDRHGMRNSFCSTERWKFRGYG